MDLGVCGQFVHAVEIAGAAGVNGHDGDMHHAVDEVIDVAFGGRRDLEDPLDGIAGGVGRRFLLISIINSFLVLVLVLLSLSFLFFSLLLLF